MRKHVDRRDIVERMSDSATDDDIYSDDINSIISHNIQQEMQMMNGVDISLQDV